MRSNIVASALVAFGLVIAALSIVDRYEIIRTGEVTTYRLDRWTGKVAMCSQWDGGTVACANAPELFHDGKTPLFPIAGREANDAKQP